ncbi:MAG: penicillin acylase family protein [Bacteroidetes bacterium]|nr:penicillin acylase family protein [Bacteroidota bacterium]
MRIFAFFVSSAVTIGLIVALNNPLGPAPAPGKFFDPYNGFWQNAENTSHFQNINLNLDGLKDKVEVYFDDRLVPHVYAKNDEDLFFMQGYITAKNRLWQMEIQTHNAAGRVSEVAGEKALPTDRMQRRIGLGFGAENSKAFIEKDAQSNDLIRAYCAGVNAYIKTLKPKDYPIEYKLLGYAPEEWTPIKVALLLKNMANMLSVYEFDIENTNFVAKYGIDQFHQLYPERDSFTDYIIPQGTKWDFAGDTTIPQGQTLASLYNNAIEKPRELNGSNNWAVSGSKTKSGKPLLCNDPHLKLNLPSIWYEMHLVSPSMNVYGATLPGAPCVISGFNDSIAWGVTNGGRDVRDWFTVKFKDDSHNEYLLDSQWVKTERRIEHIKIKGGKEFLDTVMYTRFGPIVFDKSFGDVKSKQYLSMKWTAHQGSNEFKTFYLLNRGKNYDNYTDALTNYSCPSQNFVFAARNGDIAIKEQGTLPFTKSFVTDGSKSENDWNKMIPNANNPHIKNPGRGFVSSANQFPADHTYPYPVSHVGIYENSRAMRINRLLEDTNKMDVAYMQRMQRDNYNLIASLTLPTLLRVIDRSKLTNDEKEVITALDKWDYNDNADSKTTVLYESWYDELNDLLWDEMSDPSIPMKKPNAYTTAYFIKEDSTSIFYDNQQTGERETRDMIVLESFDKAMYKLKQQYGSLANIKDWGTHKATVVHHMSPALDAFSRMNVYCGGNRGIINATSHDHGPSWRMIVDFGEMKGYCLYPGGESGNPGSKFYDDMIDKWAKGEYYVAKFEPKEQLEKEKLFKITATK